LAAAAPLGWCLDTVGMNGYRQSVRRATWKACTRRIMAS
jgi:hypothetical protein